MKQCSYCLKFHHPDTSGVHSRDSWFCSFPCLYSFKHGAAVYQKKPEAVVTEKTLRLAGTKNTVAVAWAFNGNSNLSTTGVVMAPTNASVTAGKLLLAANVSANGTASWVSPFPKNLESFEITFNVSLAGVPGAASSVKKLFSYGPLAGKLNVPASGSFGTVTIDNGGGVTSTSSSTPIRTDGTIANIKYKVVARRTYYATTAMSTFELFVDGVRCISTTGDGIALLDLLATPAFVLGGTRSPARHATEPNLWKLDTYTGTAPNYSTVDSVSALNLVYSSSGAATTSWLGEWFTDSANNNTATGASVQNYGNGLSGNFQGVTPVSSEDYSGGSNGNQILVYGQGSNIIITTEAVGYTNRNLVIPTTALTAAFTAASVTYTSNPNSGFNHTYKILRKANSTVGTVSAPSDVIQFWYDGVEIPLTVGSNGITSSGSMVNVPIGSTGSNKNLMIGPTLRRDLDATSTLDYIRFRNESAVISAPNHVSGCFQTFYGTAGYLTSNYSKTSITRGSAANGSGVLVTGIVKPITSLASATGGSIGTGTGTAMTAPFLCGVGGSTKSNKDMVELLTVGDPATAGAYVSVWAWRSGRILMFNGTSYTETVNPVVGSSEFVLGVHLSATEPQLFINGQLKSSSDAAVMLPWRTIAGNVATTISAANTGAILSSTASARGVYLGPRSTYDVTSTVTTPTLNVGYKNWRLVDTALNSMTAQQIADTQLYRYSSEYDSGPLTVTYGFRIADDETLQIVKTQGSMASTTNTMLGNILPVSEDGTGALTVNSLGAIGSSTVDPVMDLTNKR
eukprot:jgi/Mesvir1/4108/Mv13640-RA.1